MKKATRRKKPKPMLQLLDHNNNAIKVISNRARWVLEQKQPVESYLNYLKYLRKNNFRVKCWCGLIMHIVFDPDNQTYYFRRNPGQARRHKSNCPFITHEQTRPYQKAGKGFRQIFESLPVESQLLLNIIKDPELKKEAQEQKQPKKGHKSNKYTSMFNYLFTILEHLGINRYPNPVLKRNANWDDIYRYLQNTLYGMFTWCPSFGCKGGLVSLNERLNANWVDDQHDAEGLVLGILDQIPSEPEFQIKKYRQDDYPLRGARIARHQIAVIGKNGPFLFMAVCTPQKDERFKYVVPMLNRMIMQSIVSWKSLIPVDSDLERTVAKYLIKNKRPFAKPLFSVGPESQLRPDFIVDGRYILEVQGMTDDEYVQRKERIHQMMADHYGLRVVSFNPAVQEIKELP